jgi:hypothetical protein
MPGLANPEREAHWLQYPALSGFMKTETVGRRPEPILRRSSLCRNRAALAAAYGFVGWLVAVALMMRR